MSAMLQTPLAGPAFVWWNQRAFVNTSSRCSMLSLRAGLRYPYTGEDDVFIAARLSLVDIALDEHALVNYIQEKLCLSVTTPIGTVLCGKHTAKRSLASSNFSELHARTRLSPTAAEMTVGIASADESTSTADRSGGKTKSSDDKPPSMSGFRDDKEYDRDHYYYCDRDCSRDRRETTPTSQFDKPLIVLEISDRCHTCTKCHKQFGSPEKMREYCRTCSPFKGARAEENVNPSRDVLS
ncbi:hypothetical protein B0H63DRAFT_536785 [Podospora didyma]|uniref:Uncharacterized protein n=1 Tax=Podospora didyma TaxID=330526 RepID=A0AAE0JYA1_9PEZI|nr:hypothetical protein B0H63DRAFT_536785 [Podospora didyma]